MKKRLLMGSLFLISLVLGACGASESKKQANDGKIHVVATFYPMYEFTKAVVGEAGEVELILPQVIPEEFARNRDRRGFIGM